MKIKILIITLVILLFISLYYNIKPDNNWFISFSNANTRPTYDTFHNINKAQELATGNGIKVGIIGKYFGYKNNTHIYAGGKDFSGNKASFEEIAEHGLWMATTLKEIAPDAEIYALCARDKDRAKEAENISKAIDWAIENNIDILTYSAETFRIEDRKIIDEAVYKAISNNIVTTFIHYDLPKNIFPEGFFPPSKDLYCRDADVNIFHFDYNLMMIFKYVNFLKLGREVGNNIGAHPYFSNSSMSPVLAGIVAMMKEINNDLPQAEYRNILIETSKEIEYNGYNVKNSVDAYDAVNFLLKNRIKK